MALAGQFWHEAEIGKLAGAGVAEIELQHPDLDAGRVSGGIHLDAGIVDDREQRRIVEHEAREPQPWRADTAEQRAIGGRGRAIPAHQPQPRGRGGAERRAPVHLERGDDGRELIIGDIDQAHAVSLLAQPQVATGGRLIRIASMLPPVLRPKSVPRS